MNSNLLCTERKNETLMAMEEIAINVYSAENGPIALWWYDLELFTYPHYTTGPKVAVYTHSWLPNTTNEDRKHVFCLGSSSAYFFIFVYIKNM